MAITIGQQLGSYEITALLGKGGMGEVYRARDTKLKRDVAIKILPDEFSRDPERVSRFQREAEALAALNHQNIGAIYDLHQVDSTRFLILEVIEGDTLADLLEKRGALPVEEALNIGKQICEALEAAHEKGIVHRDLKPANVKVTPEGRVKVLDFGLAKAYALDPEDVSLSNSPTLSAAATQKGVILGTASYMSPEQASGTATDKRADIWSFGVVLFEMLTGRQLFTGKTVSHVLAAVLDKEPEWNSLPANLHPRVRMLLERCLEKESKDRLSGISDARVEIQRVLADPAGVLVRTPAEVVSTARRSRLPWVAAVVIAVIAGLAVWHLKPEALGPVSRFSYVLPEGQDFTIPRGGSPLVAVSPDGSRIVYVANLQLYLRAMDTLESTAIPRTREDPAAPFFSPDGQWVGYWSGQNSQLKKISVRGGAPVTLCRAEQPFGTPNWGADDTIIWGQNTGIMRVSGSGGTPERLISAKNANLASPRILPGGHSVLFNIGGGGGQVAVQALESDKPKVLFPGISPKYVPTGHLVYEVQGVLFAVPFDVATLAVKGGPVPLVEGVQAGAQYAVSDSGSLVYVPGVASAASNSVLTWVDRNGATEPLPVPPRPYRQPKLSPDGKRLAVQTTDGKAKSDIWVYDFDGRTQMKQMTGAGNNMRPIWTPDGQRLTFTSDRDGEQRIYWQLADLSGVAEPLTPPDPGFDQVAESWTPDGKTLSLSKFVGSGTNRVETLSLDKKDKPELFVAGGKEGKQSGASAFSPDGKWLVYRNMPNQSLYMQPFPATGTEIRLTQKTASQPMWSHDGRELFYRRGVRELGGAGAVVQGVQSQEFVALNIALNGTPQWSNERVLPIRGFQVFLWSRDYDITPDGKRFIMIFPADQTERREPPRPQINVVLNWFRELQERVPLK